MHGALWLSMKVSGELEKRACKVINPLLGLVISLTVVSLIATIVVRPAESEQLLPLSSDVCRAGRGNRMPGRDLVVSTRVSVRCGPFLSSGLYLFFMLAGACWGVYPTLLPSSNGAERDITLGRAISGRTRWLWGWHGGRSA